MQPLILIAEDEKSILEILKLNLEMEGFEVIYAVDGQNALDLFKEHVNKISLVLLDVMMPNINGFDVCALIKKLKSETPVMLLTAKGESEDRVKGLRLGADDYLVKPFDLEELILRINNLLRKSQPLLNSSFEFLGNKVDFEKWTFSGVNSFSGVLSKREVGLLKLLIEKRNQVVSRDEILQTVWEKTENPSSRTIDNMILVLRKYFEPDPKNPVFFQSVRGVGYRFNYK